MSLVGELDDRQPAEILAGKRQRRQSVVALQVQMGVVARQELHDRVEPSRRCDVHRRFAPVVDRVDVDLDTKLQSERDGVERLALRTLPRASRPHQHVLGGCCGIWPFVETCTWRVVAEYGSWRV